MDLRQRVLAAVDRGTPRQEIVRTLGVSQPTVRRWLRLRRETGSAAPRPLPERPFRVGSTPEEHRALWAQLEANPEATPWSVIASCGSGSTACGYRLPR
jgi:transposase-like protein